MARVRSLVCLATLGACALLGACVLVQDLGSTGDAEAVGADAAREASEQDADRGGGDGGGDGGGGGGDGGGGRDATLDGPTGPGPLGALPSGYCCTSDEQCRFRRCVDSPGRGGRMCLDACSASRPMICKRPDLDFTCQALGAEGQFCQPPASFACLDPATFLRGTKGTGSCCAFRQDGTAGRECEANLCLASGVQEWFCTRRCEDDADCPFDYRCYPIADRKECISRASTYTCR